MLSQIDIFGSQILLRFKGSHTYNTRFGSLFTLLIIGFIGFRLFFIIKDVFQRNSPTVILSDRQVDNPAIFYMTNYTFPLAFAMQTPTTYQAYIDESIYTIKAYQQIKRMIYNETTGNYDSVWDAAIQLQVQPCTEANFGNPANSNYYLKLNYSNYYCFPPDTVLNIQGDFNSDVYSQVRFIVQRCTKNCKTSDILDKYLLKATFGVQMADAYVDPTIKEQPFVSYSRDMFWPVSTKMPKDVNIYLRNSYVESDFGWIMSDIREQKFPTYSFYEDAVYPEAYQTYFLQVLFRFEKQKESVYQRSYKNLNSIISEIGGFTQSLLAIGILICTRVSQLHLNQEIINQAFNYEDSSDKEQKNEKEQLEKENEFNQQKFQKNDVTNQVMQQTLIDSKRNEQNQHLNYPQQFMLSAANSNQILTQNKNDYLSITNLKRDQDSCNVSMQQDINMSNNVNGMHQQIQSNNGLMNPYSKDDAQIQITNDQSKQQAVERMQQQGQQRNSIKRDQKQILNDLLQQKFSESEIVGDIIDGSTPQEEKIIKQKQKIQLLEQKLKESRFKQLMEKQTKSMKMSAWEYVKSSVWPFGELKKRKQIINYSIDKLYYNLDIFNIVKRLTEVEKLKRLLLDQDQIKLFDYLPKPTIHTNYVLKKDMKESQAIQGEVDYLYQDNRTEMQKARDAFQAYKTLMSKHQHSLLDQKIINLLDPNLIAVFQAQSRMAPILGGEGFKTNGMNKNPHNQTPEQAFKESPKEQVMQAEEVLNVKQEDRFLKQEMLSPRIQIDQQPILQFNNVHSGILDKSTLRNSIISESKSTQKEHNEEEFSKDLEKSVFSEIAIEETQKQPNQLVKIGKPSSNFDDE